MKKQGNYKVPFFKGHMMEYVGYMYGREGEIDWRDNVPFDATVEMVGHYRGRSAARVRVRNVDNEEVYSMGFASFYDAVKGRGDRGRMTGRWAFRKLGANYGLVPLDVAEQT